MVRNTILVGVGALSVLLTGAFAVGCSNQDSKPVTTTAVNNTTPAPQMNAADTWSQVDAHHSVTV